MDTRTNTPILTPEQRAIQKKIDDLTDDYAMRLARMYEDHLAQRHHMEEDYTREWAALVAARDELAK